MSKIKIVILGLGGVGGYYGGKLAKRFADSEDIGIYFIARGEHLKAIRQNGLHIISDYEDFFAKPTLVTDNAGEIGVADYVILTTKSYDLKHSIDQILPCIGDKTVILPLLNGGDITERIREILPNHTVWSGCSYIVSRRTEPGVIRTSGEYHKIKFGFDEGINDDLRRFDALLHEAGIDADLSENIREDIWRKFYFISVSASLTSYLNVGFNELLATEERKVMMKSMAEEFLKVANAEGINLGEDAMEKTMTRPGILPAGTTTSMHSDFKAGGKTELETLTGVIVRLARKHGIDAPMYEKVYADLLNR